MPNAQLTADRMAGECLAVRIRMLGRVISGYYDDALRPHGIGVAQMNLLAAVGHMGSPRPADVARVMRLDGSTLSRDAERLIRRGWLARAAGDDARTFHMQLTDEGRALLDAVAPAWAEAQRKASSLLGEAGVASLSRVAESLWAGG